MTWLFSRRSTDPEGTTLYAAIVAWAVLGEQPQWFHAVGAALILPGIWLATREEEAEPGQRG